MLRKDTKGKFEKEGLIFTRYRFSSGKLFTIISKDKYQSIIENQMNNPVAFCEDDSTNRKYWMYKNEFYWENDDYSPNEVKALIFEREHKKKRKVDKAISLMSQEEIPNKNKREKIPEDVRLYVWNRDGGRCAKCGSKNKIEYDHIIPVSKGGSNTARNIELLCEVCNRSKGDSLI